MKVKLKPYMTIILILCILVGIYFLWPIITDETNSVLAEEGVNGNSSISNVAEISNKTDCLYYGRRSFTWFI